jgi:ABC-2 type transport system ATP-binding protein
VAAPAVEIRNIGRVYGSGSKAVRALSEVSFDIAAGQVVALLGANGAGKTTLTKILSTLLLPTSGSARVLGIDVVHDPKAVRRRLSAVFGGDRGLYPRLTGRANLRFFGMLAGVSRTDLRKRGGTMLERFGLAEVADRRVETYSKGMRQRLHLAIGLIPRPRVLLLDEPTVGLDPLEADRLRSSIADLRSEGVSVLLTSHYLLDVEQLADRVVMLESGRVTADLPLAEFAGRAGYAAVVTMRIRGKAPDVHRLLPADASVDSCVAIGEGVELTLRLRTWGEGVFTQLGALLDGSDVVDVQVRPARLEEAFASFVGTESPDAPA